MPEHDTTLPDDCSVQVVANMLDGVESIGLCRPLKQWKLIVTLLEPFSDDSVGVLLSNAPGDATSL